VRYYLLFSLYISDIADILQSSDSSGLKVANEIIHLLMFADDMVLLAPNSGALQNKINILSDYFERMSLKVNLGKTKIMVFKRSRRKKTEFKFHYRGEEIETVKEYIYLGVHFSSNYRFEKAAKSFKKKGIASLASVWKVLLGGMVGNWTTRTKLFDSITSPTAMYCAQFWALGYLDIIEIVQNSFLKKILGVRSITSNAVVRVETNSFKMEYRILTTTLKFIVKLLCMEGNRCARICYQELFRLSDATKNNNWCLQVQDHFDRLGFSNLWSEQNAGDIAASTEEFLLRVRDVHRQNDIMLIRESSRYGYYMNILEKNPDLPWYLKERLPIRIMRNIEQVRIGLGYFKSKSYYHQLSYEMCSFCNLGEEDTLSQQTNIYINNYIHNNNTKLYTLLNIYDNVIMYTTLFNKLLRNV
jgi:hypothetical protein